MHRVYRDIHILLIGIFFLCVVAFEAFGATNAAPAHFLPLPPQSAPAAP